MTHRMPWTIGLWAVAWLLMAGHATAASQSTSQAAVDDRGHRIELPAVPQRVITLMPSLTEIVCELQACDRLVGTDRYSNWPARVPSLPKLGGLEDTPLEAVLRLKPDVVLAPVSSRAIDRLESLGVRVIALEPQSLADTERVIRLVAQVLGRPAEGPALWRRMQTRITAAAARVPLSLRGQRVYFEVAAAPYAAGRASFIGETLALLGMDNVVPAVLGPFPKLNPEFVVRAQPDIMMASASAVAEMTQRPGWQGLVALRQGRSCGFAADDYELMVRPGPRLADAAERLADCLEALGRAAGPDPVRAAVR
jgi:iron complex transport system substrate-binding protein